QYGNDSNTINNAIYHYYHSKLIACVKHLASTKLRYTCTRTSGLIKQIAYLSVPYLKYALHVEHREILASIYPSSLAPSRGYRLTVLPCSDKTCRPPRHIAYDPDRTARKTNGRDAKTSSSYLLRPGLFRDEDSAGLPESRKRCDTAKKNLKYYLPGETYILKLVLVAGKLHAKMSFRVM
ncbi:hypothetical protein ALC56_13244, partial [Trachymyrmex septentrionalis]